MLKRVFSKSSCKRKSVSAAAGCEGEGAWGTSVSLPSSEPSWSSAARCVAPPVGTVVQTWSGYMSCPSAVVGPTIYTGVSSCNQCNVVGTLTESSAERISPGNASRGGVRGVTTMLGTSSVAWLESPSIDIDIFE